MRPANSRKNENFKRNWSIFSKKWILTQTDLDFSLLRPARHFEFDTFVKAGHNNLQMIKNPYLKLFYQNLTYLMLSVNFTISKNSNFKKLMNICTTSKAFTTFTHTFSNFLKFWCTFSDFWQIFS
jgi:hypothetical protein